MPVKVGDVVLYSCQGKDHNALVLFVNEGQPDHQGPSGEPLLHLAFVAPERESEASKTKIGYIPTIFTEFDVIHAEHEFSEDYKKQQCISSPAQIAAARGQGEWRELEAEKSTKAERKSRWGRTVTSTASTEQ